VVEFREWRVSNKRVKIMQKEVSISFNFVVPADGVLATARKMASSSDPDEKTVGSTVLELTDITKRTMVAVADVRSKANYDLAVYFDFNFGGSLEAAKRLEKVTDKEVVYVADSLIEQANSIAKSKAAWQAATKQ
jgi:hypothetical protein